MSAKIPAGPRRPAGVREGAERAKGEGEERAKGKRGNGKEESGQISEVARSEEVQKIKIDLDYDRLSNTELTMLRIGKFHKIIVTNGDRPQILGA